MRRRPRHVNFLFFPLHPRAPDGDSLASLATSAVAFSDAQASALGVARGLRDMARRLEASLATSAVAMEGVADARRELDEMITFK